ncbi:MAG TPA: 5'-nucleotidase [Fimbriimonadaceae bacterium]|nr:5'-nucleotidase [Fimbriimonadaceae bacterium]
MKRLGLILITVLATTAWAQNPGAGAHLPSQAAADAIRDAAGTDGAFLAAGLVRETYSPDNLASLLQFPTDEIVVVRLKGSEVRQALERSVSLYPQPNSSFLQLSGFSVEFTGAGDPQKRILNVNAGGGDLDENKSYTVAMPATLGRGGQGYFKIWDKAKIERTLSGVTVESVLKGKRFATTSPRWVLR